MSVNENAAVAPADSAVTRVSDAQILHREMTLVPRSYDPATREADAVVSIGAVVRRNDWDGEFDEALDMSPRAIRMGRLNGGAQLLDSHNGKGGLDAILGAVVPGSATIRDGKLGVRFKFSNSEKGQRVARDLADGIPLPLSAGYRVFAYRDDSTKSPLLRTAVDWEPVEVSIVAIAAEGNGATGFRSAPVSQSGDKNMTPANTENGAQRADGEGVVLPGAVNNAVLVAAPSAPVIPAVPPAPVVENRAAPAAPAITGVAPSVTHEDLTRMLDLAKRSGMDYDDVMKAVKEGVTLDSFRDRAFDVLAGKSRDNGPKGGARGGEGSDNGWSPAESVDHSESHLKPLSARGQAMVEGLTTRLLAQSRPTILTPEQTNWQERARALGRVDEVERAHKVYRGQERPHVEQAREYLGRSFVEIAAECIDWKGRVITPQTAGSIIERAFHSTSDFPSVFENVMNKALLARYTLQAPTYRELGQERPFKDFRPHPMYRMGDFPMLEPIKETGEMRWGTSTESKETASVSSYAIIIAISRQMIINDDMGAIDQMLGSYGQMVQVFENTKFFEMLLSNTKVGPTLLEDSKAVFHTDHGNLAGSGAAPTIASLSAARKSLRLMKNISGAYINVAPTIILSGPGSETSIDQMLTSITPMTTATVNPFSGKLRSIVDANIDDYAWYMLAAPGSLPNFIYGFLQGAGGPRLRSEEPFGYQGVRMSLEHDFGVGAIDYRGIYRDPGAAAS